MGIGLAKDILLINVDPAYESIYCLLLAGALKQSQPGCKITMLATTECAVFKKFNIFENIHFADVSEFFAKTDHSSQESIEREMKLILAPMLHQVWDHVINTSVNLLGSFLASYLKYKDLSGMVFDFEKNDHQYSNVATSLFVNPQSEENVIHYNSFIGLIAGIESQGPLVKYLDSAEISEVSERLKQLKIDFNKKKIVLIDTKMRKTGKIQNFHFVTSLYAQLSNSTDYLPILLASEAEDTTFLVSKLREVCKHELHLMSAHQMSWPALVSSVDVVVCEDLFLKSMADALDVSSLTIWTKPQLPYSDFSIVPRSYLYHTHDDPEIDLNAVTALLSHMLSGETLSGAAVRDIFLYQSSNPSSATLIPVSLYTESFAHWWLRSGYIYQALKGECPAMKFSGALLVKVVMKQRNVIKEGLSKRMVEYKKDHKLEALWMAHEGQADGILDLALQIPKFEIDSGRNDIKSSVETLKILLQELLDFLAHQESQCQSSEVIVQSTST